MIREAEFGDQFVVLGNLHLYTRDTGLEWNDPTFVPVERLIVA